MTPADQLCTSRKGLDVCHQQQTADKEAIDYEGHIYTAQHASILFECQLEGA